MDKALLKYNLIEVSSFQYTSILLQWDYYAYLWEIISIQ